MRSASEHVSGVLYIHLDPAAALSANTSNNSSDANTTNLSLCQASSLIKTIYGKPLTPASLDVRVILTGFKGLATVPLKTNHAVQKVMIDAFPKERLPIFRNRYKSFLNDAEPIVLLHEEDALEVDNIAENGGTNGKIYKDIVAGGTFDRIHSGHKILLSEGLLRCTRKFTIGMADGPLLTKKTLKELIEPINVRIEKLSNLMSDLDPGVEHYLEPIYEPLGPSGRDPDMEMIIVSQETLKGGNYVNKVRAERNLGVLDVVVIDLVEDASRDSSVEEEKVSSSSARMRLLGSLLKEPDLSMTPPSPPYVIGLTGGEHRLISNLNKP